MKIKIRYAFICISIITIILIFPNMFTRAKYVSKIEMQTPLKIGYLIFDITSENNSTYSIEKGEQKNITYSVKNYDANSNINRVDAKCYIKIVDENNNENLPLQITVNDSTYVSGKGYEIADLKFDGETKQTKNIEINVECPSNYDGSRNLTYKVKAVVYGISNEDIYAEESIDLKLNVISNDSNENSDSNEANENSVSNETNENNNNIVSNEISESNETNSSVENTTNEVQDQTNNTQEQNDISNDENG